MSGWIWHLFGAKVTGIAKVGSGREGGIKDHSQLLTEATEERMVLLLTKGRLEEGGGGPWSLNRNKWLMMKMEGGGAEMFVGCGPSIRGAQVCMQKLLGT